MLDHPRADGYGLRCDKLLVLDLDTYKDDFDLGPIPFGLLRWRTCTDTPKGGKHYFFQPHPEIKMQTGVIGTKGVDIRTGRGSFVRIYGPPPQSIKPIPDALAHHLKNVHKHEPVLASGIATRYKIQEYLYKINSDCRMEQWVAVLSAIKNLSGDKQQAWEWSSNSKGECFKRASWEEFDTRYESLDAHKYTKLCSLRYLKRLANELD